MPLRWTPWHYVAAALLLALSAFVHFTVVLQTNQKSVVHGDAGKYIFYAYNLRYHSTFSHQMTLGEGQQGVKPVPDKLTLPGYPAFLSLFVDGVPDQDLIRRVTLAQATLGVVSTLLGFLIALRLMTLGWAFVAGVLIAIQPHLALASTYLLTESLFTVLMLASVLAALVAVRDGTRLRWFAVTGLLLGMACLVRPQLQLIPLLALVMGLFLKRRRPCLPGIVLGVACFIAVIGPWYLRNANVQRPQGDPSLLAASIYHGSFPNMMFDDDPRTLGYAYRFDPGADQAVRDLPSALRSVRTRFSREPARYLRWYLVGKPGFFLSWGMITGSSDLFIYGVDKSSPFVRNPVFMAFKNISYGVHWPLMLLAALATFLAFWRPATLRGDLARQTSAAVLATLFLYLIVLHCIGAPYPRYNVPFRPLAFILAMLPLQAASGWIAQTRRQKTRIKRSS